MVILSGRSGGLRIRPARERRSPAGRVDRTSRLDPARADPDLTPENARCPDSYPARSVMSGSAFAARRDGTRHASRATPASRRPATPNAAGSPALTPTRNRR